MAARIPRDAVIVNELADSSKSSSEPRSAFTRSAACVRIEEYVCAGSLASICSVNLRMESANGARRSNPPRELALVRRSSARGAASASGRASPAISFYVSADSCTPWVVEPSNSLAARATRKAA